jgi:hypothetical protein
MPLPLGYAGLSGQYPSVSKAGGRARTRVRRGTWQSASHRAATMVYGLPPSSRRTPRPLSAHAFGVRTPSIRYTVALAVWTPPQITLLPLMVRLSAVPDTVTGEPSTVFWSPTILSGEI